MPKANLKTERKYRSYGSSDPFFLVAEEGKRNYPSALADKAYRALHIAFVALPIVAGVDKFVFVLTDWSAYAAPSLTRLFATSPQSIAYGAGVLEIFLGIGILMRPRVFADLFSLWVVAITINLLVQGEHFDIALFNFALAAGSCALARLSKAHELADPLEPPSLEDEDLPAA
jgi:hypothetical protein